jgi:D-serine deaminase-like pyridoxal phosphate-dependent protein
MWYKPVNESSLATPCILLFPDRIEENIRRMIAIAGGAGRVRPHVKTHKIAEVVQLQLNQGIQQFKCATIAEAVMVAEAGGKDILLSYPLFGPALEMWFELIRRFPGTRLSVTVDSETAIDRITAHALDTGMKVDLFVDLDNGMHRTGIAPEKALPLIRSIAKNSNLRFRGLHIYDGHIHEADPEQRRAHCERDFEPVTRLVDQMEKEGIGAAELACGGTPTFPIHASHPSRTMCPGTPLLWDAGYGRTIPDLDFLPAAVVAGRIISKPFRQLCTDLGHKSIASEMSHPRLQFLDLDTEGVVNHSEEHLVLSTGEPDRYSEGDLVYALPVHICPTMALHEQVYVVRNRYVTETWRVVARKRLISI